MPLSLRISCGSGLGSGAVRDALIHPKDMDISSESEVGSSHIAD
jgi:hypothetical protein